MGNTDRSRLSGGQPPHQYSPTVWPDWYLYTALWPLREPGQPVAQRNSWCPSWKRGRKTKTMWIFKTIRYSPIRYSQSFRFLFPSACLLYSFISEPPYRPTESIVILSLAIVQHEQQQSEQQIDEPKQWDNPKHRSHCSAKMEAADILFTATTLSKLPQIYCPVKCVRRRELVFKLYSKQCWPLSTYLFK